MAEKTKVIFKKNTSLNNVPIKDGQLVFNTDTGAHYIDVGNQRKPLNSGDYVTPEMYGAIGDGATDDTRALQIAIDTGKTVVAMQSYKTSAKIILSKSEQTIIFNKIFYHGADVAIEIAASGDYICFNQIKSKGDGVRLLGKSNIYGRTAIYNTIIFDSIWAFRHGIQLITQPDATGGAIMLNTIYGGVIVCNRYAFDDEPSSPEGNGIMISSTIGDSIYINNNKFFGISIFHSVIGVDIEAPGNNKGDTCYGNVFTNLSIEDTEGISTHAIKVIESNGFVFENATLDEVRTSKIEIKGIIGCGEIRASGDIFIPTFDIDLTGKYNSEVIVNGIIRNAKGALVSHDIRYSAYGGYNNDPNQKATQVKNGKLLVEEIPGNIVSIDGETNPCPESVQTISLKYLNKSNSPNVAHHVRFVANQAKYLKFVDYNYAVIIEFYATPKTGIYDCFYNGTRWVHNPVS